MQHPRASEQLNSMNSIVMIKKHIKDNNGALKLSKRNKMSLALLVIEEHFTVGRCVCCGGDTYKKPL